MGRLPAPVGSGSDLDAAIYSHVITDAAVSAIIESRFFPGAIPEGQILPAAVYQQISAVHDETLDGADGLANARFQLSAWAATRIAAKALAETIRLRLQSYRGTLGSVVIQDISLIDRRDLLEEAVNNAQQRRYGVQLDFEIWFDEAVPTR